MLQMKKSGLSLTIIIISIIGIIAFFYILKSTFITKFIIISALFGPGMGISYGLENPAFKPGAHLLTLLIVNILAIILIYTALRKLSFEKNYKNKVLNRVMFQVQKSQKGMEETMNKVSSKLEKRFGDIGSYLALILITFGYGAYIAGAIAFFVNVKRNQAMFSIAIGSLISLIFWWYLALGVIPFITPTMVFLVITSISIILILIGFIKDKKMIKEISERI
jgi:uncharacterized membrane protein